MKNTIKYDKILRGGFLNFCGVILRLRIGRFMRNLRMTQRF